MSINNNHNSEYEQYKQNRRKINVNLFSGNSNGAPLARCRVCLPFRLDVRDGPKGKEGFCNHCGNTFQLTENHDVSAGGSKYVARFGTASGKMNSFIISKERKGSKPRRQIGSVNESLSQEDIDDIRRITGSEVS
jgi:hypothetical protein